MTTDQVIHEIDDRGVATVTLNRPRVHNAFNDAVIARLMDVFTAAGDDERVRAVVLRAEGKSFSAGADVNWMRQAAAYSRDRNIADAMRLGEMLRTLNTLPKPVLALVQGAALGGGVGLVACADIAIAGPRARFGLTEVRLGLIPATISPYVIAAIGARQARRYFLTGERFDAEEAFRIGLVHQVVKDDDGLRLAGENLVDELLAGAPGAIADAKRLISHVSRREVDDRLVADTAEHIADRRASDEGKEGLTAFLEKRAPQWRDRE